MESPLYDKVLRNLDLGKILDHWVENLQAVSDKWSVVHMLT